MKLKKIASLAAAGVMAMSMLAGCAEANANSTPNPIAPVESGAKGVSAGVEAYVTANYNENYITFADDAALGSDLAAAVEFVGVQEVLDGYVNTNNLMSPWRGRGLDFVDKLENEVGVTSFVSENNPNPVQHTLYNIGLNSTLVAEESVAQNDTEIPDARAVDVWVISSAIGENAINEKVADRIENTVAAYQRRVDRNNVGNYSGSSFNFDYTVSVSTYTKTVNSSIMGNWGMMGGSITGAEDPEVTFVAVQVVRTATEQ